MSTVLSEVTVSPRPPVRGETEVHAALQGLEWGPAPPRVLSHVPGAKGGQAGCTHCLWLGHHPEQWKDRQLALEPSRE